MKEVTIKSKIVGRGGASAATSPGKGVSVDMSGYLLKKIWEKVFEIRVTETGEEYLFGKLHFAAQYGVTMYANGGLLDLPNIFKGLPIDNDTIYWDGDVLKSRGVGEGGVTPTLLGDLTNVGSWANAVAAEDRIMVQKKGGSSWSSMLLSEIGGGSADFSNVLSSGSGNAYTSFTLSEDKKTLTFLKDKTFAEKSTSLSGYGITDAYTKTAVDGLLEGKADSATTLAGYGITNAYTKTQVDNLLGDFVTSDDVETLLDGYLPLTGGTITGDLRLRKGSEYTSPYLYFGDSDEVWLKEVTDTHLTIHADGSVKIDSPKTVIDGIEIKKSASGVLFIDANLVLSGGITMYGTDGTTANTIWDDAPIASTSVKGIASFDSNYFAVNNGKVTFIGSTGGGGIDSITKQMVIDALGFTPYDEDNPDGFITGITKTMVTTALGYTPYNSTNPDGFITGITKSMVTTALGFTPYNATNPNGYVTSSGSVAYATSAGSAEDADYATTSGACSGNAATATTLKTSRTIWGKSFNGSGNVSGDMSSVGHITPNAHNGRSIGAYDNSFLKVHANYLTSGASANNLLLVGGSSASYGIIFALNANGGNSGHKMAMGSDRLYPYTDGGMSLGSTYYCWDALYLNTGDNDYSDADIYFNSGGTTYARIGSNDSGNLGLYARTSVVIRGGATGSNAPKTGATIDASGNLLMTGGITMYSDLRKKTILNHVELSLKEVADAPLIEHYYNSDEKKTTHVGSVAQYWAGLNDWFCKEDEEGFLTMEIQNAALASAISVARELTRYESKTDKQIKKLKKRIGELEEEIENLKKV